MQLLALLPLPLPLLLLRPLRLDSLAEWVRRTCLLLLSRRSSKAPRRPTRRRSTRRCFRSRRMSSAAELLPHLPRIVPHRFEAVRMSKGALCQTRASRADPRAESNAPRHAKQPAVPRLPQANFRRLLLPLLLPLLPLLQVMEVRLRQRAALRQRNAPPLPTNRPQ